MALLINGTGSNWIKIDDPDLTHRWASLATGEARKAEEPHLSVRVVSEFLAYLLDPAGRIFQGRQFIGSPARPGFIVLPLPSLQPELVPTRLGLDSGVAPGLVLRLALGSGQSQAIERLKELGSLARGPEPDARQAACCLADYSV